MASVKTCDHCERRIEDGRGHFNVTFIEDRGGSFAFDASPNEYHFCDIACLTGWSDTRRDMFGYASRIPLAGSMRGK